jgi:hypothetical protein
MIQVVAYARFTLYGTHGEAPHRRLMKGRRYTQRIERHDRPVEIGRYSPCLCLYEERLVGLTTNRKRNVPVSATKYIKPSYNKLWSRVRHITTTTRKMTYIFISFEALQRVSDDATN